VVDHDLQATGAADSKGGRRRAIGLVSLTGAGQTSEIADTLAHATTRAYMSPTDTKAAGAEQACWAPGGLFCRIKMLVLLLLILGVVLAGTLTSG
jgi:hypothetical protein